MTSFDPEQVANIKRDLIDAPTVIETRRARGKVKAIAEKHGVTTTFIGNIVSGLSGKHIQPTPKAESETAPQDHLAPGLPDIWVVKQSFAVNHEHPSIIVWKNYPRMDATIPSVFSTQRYVLVGAVAVRDSDVLHVLAYGEWPDDAQAHDVRHSQDVHIHRESYVHANHWAHQNAFVPNVTMGSVPPSEISPQAATHHANAAMVEDKPQTALSAA